MYIRNSHVINDSSAISDEFDPPDRPIDKPFRCCVWDIFKGTCMYRCIEMNQWNAFHEIGNPFFIYEICVEFGYPTCVALCLFLHWIQNCASVRSIIMQILPGYPCGFKVCSHNIVDPVQNSQSPSIPPYTENY